MRALLILSVLIAIALACVSLSVNEIRSGNTVEVKVSYFSYCSGKLRIEIFFGSNVYSVSGMGKFEGRKLIIDTQTFPGDFGGLSAYFAGPPELTILVYLNGELLTKRVVGKCLDFQASLSSPSSEFLGFSVPKGVKAIGITIINHCEDPLKVKVTVEGGKPMKKVPASRCILYKKKVELVKVCEEVKCSKWTVGKQVCSEREGFCKLVYDKLIDAWVSKCEYKCLKRSPIYYCLSHSCSKWGWEPRITGECIKASKTFLVSQLPIKGSSFSGEILLGPKGVKSLNVFFEGGKNFDVKVDGSIISLKEKKVSYAVSRIEWVPTLISLMIIAIALWRFLG
ncbi:hypothetical protein IPA_06445 [Ignicoccus pacificus DSM 13166]|uniref:Uncharacterized protein n=1 Tax=Ignicoccus pacificus DSM 13166 TaxID=940294 RepID=A0A977KBI4_9CREN|nr:hypothetical protein IPA_06445 [Ignicoccus pacificus DSM 13166]